MQFLTLSTTVSGRELFPTGSTEECFQTELVLDTLLHAGSLTNISWKQMHFECVFGRFLLSEALSNLYLPVHFTGFRGKY